MFTLISGLILLAVPFVLVELFSDKKRGFIYVLFSSLLFQAILAITTQALGVFYYWTIAGATFFADLILIAVYFRLRFKTKKKFSFSFGAIDWIVLAVALISFLSLYQVHYNFTGEISVATDTTANYHEVKNMVYPYPYFSDEWYAVSLVESSIINHSLPVTDILNNTFFLNLEIFFHSFIAEITLLLGLNPLLQYTILSIFFNTVIILLIYLFLRTCSASRMSAGVCSLLALYITSGANLPGFWQLIPFNIGIIFFILSLCFMEFGDAGPAILSTVMASLFYPPLIPFFFVGLASFLLLRLKLPAKRLAKVALTWLLSIFAVLLALDIIVMSTPLAGALKYILARIFFISFTTPYLPRINFYDIIPMAAIILSFFGLYYIFKNKKWILLSELAVGVIYWIFYAVSGHRFFAEYERISIFTSVIVVIISGLGLGQIERYMKTNFPDNWYDVLRLAEVVALSVFLFLVPTYTNSQGWQKIISVNPVDGSIAYPRSPANNYLTAEDLRIFKNIKNKSFLSIPWKGTVVGIVTGNYPILTKQGTISIGSQDMLNNFSRADCQGKEKLVKKFKLDYIYLYKFDCPSFKKIDASNEGFILYKTDLK